MRAAELMVKIMLIALLAWLMTWLALYGMELFGDL